MLLYAMNLDKNLFRAKIYHGLKSIYGSDDTLTPRYLEIAICNSFGFAHVGDSAFYADGICDQIQMSIKTRMISPHRPKTKPGRDFQSDPLKFLGPQHNAKQDKWTGGLEIVQRRQQLDFKNDMLASAARIGRASLKGFDDNVKQSHARYNTTTSYEVIGVHGYDCTGKYYLISLFWQSYCSLDTRQIQWVREGSGVAGYTEVDSVAYKVCERINGNAKREATCFKEYKDLTKFTNSFSTKLPLPEPWQFQPEQILEEINQQEKKNAGILPG